MAKKSEIEGYSVIVFVPVTRFRDNPDHVFSDARTIRDDILRHVDGDYDLNIDIEPQTRETCEFCGYHWSSDCHDYNGGCCEEDERQRAEEREPAE